MKQFKIKYKILLYGFPPVDENFIIDNFELKSYMLYKNLQDKEVEVENFPTSIYLLNCCYKLKDDDNIYYNYFENINELIVDIPNNLCNKNDIQKYIMNNTCIKKIIYDLEKKLRLMFNIRIIFPMIRITIHDIDNHDYGYVILTKDFPGYSWQHSFCKEIFEFNSHFMFSLESFSKLEEKNAKFEKAMSYFYSSFDSNSISIRFTMLFSSMEALLIRSKTQVTEKLSLRMSRLLKCIDPKLENDTYKDIKELYNIRSKYIHGSKKNNITRQDEEKLRKYVREVLIIYWMYALNNKLTANQIINNLDNEKNLDYITRTTARYIRTLDFKKAYVDACEDIAEGIISSKIKITEIKNGVIKSVREIK